MLNVFYCEVIVNLLKEKFGPWLAEKMGVTQAVQAWMAGEDTPDTKNSKPTKPYKQVDLVFACVNKLIDGIAGIPAVISTPDDKIVEGGPAYDLLFRNHAMSWTAFVTQAIGHYALTRDVFFVFTDTQGTQPKEIMVVSGSQMHPITHNRQANGMLLGWEFRGVNGQRVKFTTDEVHQWKNFNPYDRFHGLGPATASKLSIDYSYAAALYNSSALANGAEPGAMLFPKGKLDPEQVRMLRSQFDARHKGAANVKRTAVLSGIEDVKTIALKMTDMQVAKISEQTDKKICTAFGVPPGLVGLITEAQYSHGPAQRDFIFNTIIPWTKLFAGELTTGIISRFYPSESRSVTIANAKMYRGTSVRLAKKRSYFEARQKAVIENKNIFLWFDTDQHPTVQDANREIAAKVLDYTKAGVPLNDIIRTHDLPYEQVPWGDDWWIGMGQVPARFALEAGIEGLTGPSAPEGEDDDDDKKSITAITAKQIVDMLTSEQKTKADRPQQLRWLRRDDVWQHA